LEAPPVKESNGVKSLGIKSPAAPGDPVFSHSSRSCGPVGLDIARLAPID